MSACLSHSVVSFPTTCLNKKVRKQSLLCYTVKICDHCFQNKPKVGRSLIRAECSVLLLLLSPAKNINDCVFMCLTLTDFT